MRVLRIKDVQFKTGLPRSQIYTLIARGEFPKQIKLSERIVGWLESEIDAWIETRAQAHRAA